MTSQLGEFAIVQVCLLNSCLFLYFLVYNLKEFKFQHIHRILTLASLSYPLDCGWKVNSKLNMCIVAAFNLHFFLMHSFTRFQRREILSPAQTSCRWWTFTKDTGEGYLWSFICYKYTKCISWAPFLSVVPFPLDL